MAVTNDTLLALSLILSPQTITAALDLVETRAGTHDSEMAVDALIGQYANACV